MTQAQNGPSPQLIFDTLNGLQRTAVLKGAIDLELFTAIGEGNASVPALAARCGASERGIRVLCDYLTAAGFLVKADSSYRLTPDSAVFLDKKSPAYMGTVTGFLLHPALMEGFKDVAETVRRGTTLLPQQGTVETENPLWVHFARSMAPMMAMPAGLMAELVDPDGTAPLKILDIAAGHGLFGIAFAKRNPNARVAALDWKNVLAVAAENAEAAGVADRHESKPGSAFDTDFGDGYDLVLLTNFLHHFDFETNVGLLKKVRAALAPGGRAVTLEFVPNDDRVTPPHAAMFSMVMLCGTPAGDAYTFAELNEMALQAGFSRNEHHHLTPIQDVMISHA